MNFLNRVTPQELVDFTKNLAVMLKSGIAINKALTFLAEQTKSKIFSRIIYKVKSKVEMGTSLSEAFVKEEKTFGRVFISLLRAGEKSGTLEENLSFLADWLERNHDLRKEIKAVTLYPKFVFSVTFLLAGGLAVFILPKLVPLFEQLRVELPLATRILLAFSLFIEKFWFLVLLGIIGTIIAFILLNKIKTVRRFFHLLYIKTPFFGAFMIDYQLALVCQLLSTLFRSGLSIRESLKITSEAATNMHYQESIDKARERVQKGTTLSQAMGDYPNLYPKNLVNIIMVGETSGNLDKSFVYLTEFYSKEVNNKTKKLPIVLEPLLLIFIGLAVGFVAFSILMPIYELTGGLR